MFRGSSLDFVRYLNFPVVGHFDYLRERFTVGLLDTECKCLLGTEGHSEGKSHATSTSKGGKFIGILE